MTFLRFVVLKSNYNERYLGYVQPKEFEDIHQGVAPSRNNFLRFDRDEVSTTYTKFEIERAKIGNGLVHIKSCYNNKYWVRWSPNHWWIVAAADQPEEDRSKWFCTLFKPVYIDRNANTIRFLHSQLGHYACLWRIGLPFGDCLFGGSKDADNDSCDVITVINWESVSTSTSRPGGSGGAAVTDEDDDYGSAVDQDNNNATSLPW